MPVRRSARDRGPLPEGHRDPQGGSSASLSSRPITSNPHPAARLPESTEVATRTKTKTKTKTDQPSA